MKPEIRKNRKNVGLELRRTHYTLGNDRKIHLKLIELYRVELSFSIST